MHDKSSSMPPGLAAMSLEDFAMLGGQQIAYVREMDALSASEMFPAAKTLPPDMRVYTLYAANGTPIMLSDSRESLISNAFENELNPVCVH